MLRGDLVGDGDGAAQISGHDDLAVCLHAGPGDLLPGQQGQLGFDLPLYRQGQIHGIRHQHGSSVFIMLRLAQQVSRQTAGVALPIGDHQDLAGSGDHVDGHLAEHLLLGLRHKGTAGAYDLIHRRHGLRAVGQGGHGLGTPQLEDPIHSGDLRRRQDGGGNGAVRHGRGDHADLSAARQSGGDGVHQHRGGQGRTAAAAGDADAHPLQGDHPLAHDESRLLGHFVPAAHLLDVVSADVGRRALQHPQELRGYGGHARLQLRSRYLQTLQLHMVEGLFKTAQGGIPFAADSPQDLRHGAGYVGGGGAALEDGRIGLLAVFHDADHALFTCAFSRSVRSRISFSLNW